MSLEVRFSAEAAAEFADLAAWYEGQDPGLGEPFVGAVEATIGFMAGWPGLGSLVPGVGGDLEIRRAPVRRFPYHVVYAVLHDHLRVLAVAHDRRLPTYWASRTGE